MLVARVLLPQPPLAFITMIVLIVLPLSFLFFFEAPDCDREV